MTKQQWMDRALRLEAMRDEVYDIKWPAKMKEEFDQLVAKFDDLSNLCWAEAERLEKQRR
jgi:hypothetical protein